VTIPNLVCRKAAFGAGRHASWDKDKPSEENCRPELPHFLANGSKNELFADRRAPMFMRVMN